MGKLSFEYLLGCHAAPTLAGLKPASLLAFQRARFRDFDALLSSYDACFRCKGISVCRLSDSRSCSLVLFYRARQLARRLAGREAEDFLSGYGYRPGSSLEDKLLHLKGRIRSCEEAFPHEVGLFLGYPLEDVQGFIRHKGQGFVCCGYWKVYANEGEARALFDRYASCTREFCTKLDAGMTLPELLEAV